MSDDTVFAPLRHATFRNLWIGSTLSNTGSLIQSVAAGWTMAAISTADHVALVQTASFLPIALLALPAGALADTYDRRSVQIAAQWLGLAGALLMAAASILGLITPWVLLGFCFLLGSGNALAAPSRSASIGEQVPRTLLPQAVALNSIGYNLARSVGPAIGGVIVAAFGATTAFALNALSYLPLIRSLQRWQRVAEVPRLPPEGLLRSINTGLRYIAHMQPVRQTMLRSFLICVLGAAFLSIMPLVARDLLGGGARSFGLLLGGFGVGAVSGILVLHPLRNRLGNEQTVRLCCLVLAASLAVLAFSHSLALDLAALLPAGAAWMSLTTTLNIAVQLAVPKWVAGRAIATSTASTSLGVAVGSWIWGEVAAAQGVAVALQCAGIGLLLSPALGLLLRVAEGTAAPEPDDRPIADPEVKLGIVGDSGPISIELQYRVPLDKAATFYSLMRQIQRSRSRNGAYDWSLSRNIADPEQWSERFRCPTWDDYLRLRSRRTQQDADLQRRASELHVGIEPIKVLRWLDRPSESVRGHDEAARPADDTLGLPM